ncbi:MAG: hypothetical protein ING59_08170 [Burkholderiales bacterium]|jgi:hypothetical protein|nr:hypothetical protein [Burkholderiales bacterium]
MPAELPPAGVSHFSGDSCCVVLLVAPLDASLAQAVREQCGGPVLAIEPQGELPAQAESARSALLVLDPQAHDSAAMLLLLQALERQGMPFGVVLACDAEGGALAVAKAARPHRLALPADDWCLLWGPNAPAVDDGAPPAALSADGARHPASAALVIGARAVMASSHGNALDAGLSPWVILCARAGSAYRGARAFSCFDDGRCFRQPSYGRDETDRAGLVSLAELDAELLILSGCNVVAPYRAWVDGVTAFQGQWPRSRGAALVAAFGTCTASVEADLVLLAGLARGETLGAAVAEANRFRRAKLREASGLPEGVGPLLLLGHPDSRVEGLAMQRPRVECDAGGERLHVDLGGVDASGVLGVLLDIALPPHAQDATFWCVESHGGTWLRGACTGPRLVLWLAGAPASLVLRFSHADPWQAARADVESRLAELPFWRVFCTSTLADRKIDGEAAEQLSGVLQSLGDTESRLRRGHALLRGRPHALDVSAAARDRIAVSLAAAIDAHDAACCRAAAQVVRRLSSRAFSVWCGEMHGGDVLLQARPCACGAPVQARRVEMPGTRVTRLLRLCPACGPIGEENFASRFKATLVTPQLQAGETLRWTLDVAAQPALGARLRAMAVFESKSVAAAPPSALVCRSAGPSLPLQVELELPLPPKASAGTYAACVVAVIDGALAVTRFNVAVSPPPAARGARRSAPPRRPRPSASSR